MYNTIKKLFSSIFNVLIIFTTLIVVNFLGCENNPNDLGLNYVQPFDTLKAKVIDTRKGDTILITASNPKYFVNTSVSPNILVGRYQGYESRSLLKFNNLPADHDSAVVLSANLYFKYTNYYFQDSSGLTSFNIYKLKRNINFGTVTNDSVTSADFDNVVLGTYTGTFYDTATITLPFDNQTVSDWFKYARDTNYINKNFGIVLLPNLNSTTIKAFYSSNQADNVKPYLRVISQKGTTIDTLILKTTEFVSLNDLQGSVASPDHFTIQCGVAYREMFKFDISKLPVNVIINEAYIEFKLDYANSFIAPGTDKRFYAAMLTDSVLQNTDGNFITSNFVDSLTYYIRFNPILQRWNSGVTPNYGLLFKGVSEQLNLNKLSFYSQSYSDITKRPRIRIIYTLRN